MPLMKMNAWEEHPKYRSATRGDVSLAGETKNRELSKNAVYFDGANESGRYMFPTANSFTLTTALNSNL